MASIEKPTPPTQTDGTIAIVNPSTGRSHASIPKGTSADVDHVVSLARVAHGDGRWRFLAPAERARLLRAFADLIEGEATALDALDAEDMGKPVSLGLFNALGASSLMRYCADAALGLTGDVLASDRHSHITWQWAPRGVVAAIVPWNFPAFIAVMKIAPALAAGNCVILKPSEFSPRSAVRLVELGASAGLPDDVLTILLGAGETVGRAIGLHADVAMLAFTGSTAVGKLMLQYAGQSNMKTVIAECGGKSPQIVFDDGVDLDAAADSISGFLLANQGQVCSVGSRLLVQRSIQSALVERIADRMNSVIAGDALNPTTTFGPLASARQFDRVRGFIASAGEAELVTGGYQILESSGGYFMAPTLFQNVDPASQLAQEEIFGPVLAVTPFDDEAEAIRLANGTRYGLAAYVWTADLARGLRMKEIRSSVWIYASRATGGGAGHATPLEPYGQSGVGVEGGLAGIQSYMRRQTLAYHYG